MSLLKFVASFSKLLERNYHRLINVSCNQRKFHLMNVGIKVKKMDNVTLKPPRYGIQHKTTSVEHIEQLLATGNADELKRRAEENIVRNGVVTVPEDMTENEFVEVSSDSIRTMYAQTRLANLSPEEEKRLKILKVYHSFLESLLCAPTPEYMTDGHWVYLLLLGRTKGSIQNVLYFWYGKEERQNAKKVPSKKVPSPKKVLLGEKIRSNNIFRRKGNRALSVHYGNNLAFSMQYGQPLIFDFSFGSEQAVRDLRRTIRQFKLSHKINKQLWEPFHMYVCGFPSEGKFHHMLINEIGHLLRSYVPITVTTKDVHEIDAIPREKLVYLSPDAPKKLKKFNRDDVYVIGGITESAEKLPHSFAKAKRLELRSARLPLDRYVVFKKPKTLTIHDTTSILKDLKNGMSMRDAVQRGVPSYKIKFLIGSS